MGNYKNPKIRKHDKNSSYFTVGKIRKEVRQVFDEVKHQLSIKSHDIATNEDVLMYSLLVALDNLDVSRIVDLKSLYLESPDLPKG